MHNRTARRWLQLIAVATCWLLLAGCGAGTVGARVLLTPDTFTQRTRLPFKIKWTKDLGVERLLDEVPFERSVPLLKDGALYVGSSAQIFAAFEARSGEMLWSFETEGPVESVAAADDRLVYLGDSNGKIYALLREDGSLVWSYRTKGEVLCRLTVQNETLYAATSYSRVLALNAKDGQLLWLADHDPADDFTIRGVSSPLVTERAVYAGYSDGAFAAIDPRNGTELWATTLKSGQRRFRDVDATPVLFENKLYVSSFDGKLYCLEPDTGTIVWSFEHGGVSQVAINNGLIYFASDDNLLYAVRLEDGQMVWSYDLKADYERDSIYKGPRSRNQIPGAPLIVNDVVICASMAGYVYALDSLTGEKRWAFLPGEGVTSAVASDGERLYFLSNSGRLYCLRQSGPPRGY